MILTCMITHNRLDLTKLTVESYLNTTSVKHYLVVVDNASVDGTREYLQSIEEINLLILSGTNMYPGRACNLGWEQGLLAYPQAEYLHRSDNDLFYGKSWDDYSLDVFDAMPRLGQFGILDLADHSYPGQKLVKPYEEGGQTVNRHYPNVGGNHLTRRVLWDLGVRHIENTWVEGAAGNEDEKFSLEVAKREYFFAHSMYPLATHLGIFKGYYKNRRYLEYYRRTYKERLKINLYPDIPEGGDEF